MTPRTQSALVRIATKALDQYLATGTGLEEVRQALRALERDGVSPTRDDMVLARQAMRECDGPEGSR